jgi:hypothetical protein
MPRPVSWLPRLHEIRRAVASSVRSHYERKEIESLFQVQPRAAQLLLEMLPTSVIGRSRLVERQTLADFLDRIHKADDPSAELDLIRAQGGKVSRKKIRTLVRLDSEPLQLDSLPANRAHYTKRQKSYASDQRQSGPTCEKRVFIATCIPEAAQAGSLRALDVMAVGHFSGSGQLIDELVHGGEDLGFVGTVDVVIGVGHTDDLS